jgi:hypothetical protein
MATLTTGVRMTATGYVGTVTIRDVAASYRRETDITRQTREDALFDAAGLATDMALEACPQIRKELTHA